MVLAVLLALQLADSLPVAARPSPPHAAAFAPTHAAGRYRFYVTDASIDDVARAFRERHPSPSPESWKVAPGSPAEAFDAAALFDRSRLARLYGGLRPRMARGPAVVNKTDAVVLLLSPYPEPDSSALNPGTLIMVVEAPDL